MIHSILVLILLTILSGVTAFASFNRCTLGKSHDFSKIMAILRNGPVLKMGLGDFTIQLEKPLGMILEERQVGGGGVMVKELVEDGAALISGAIAPGDVLLQVDDTDVSEADFDSVMECLMAAPSKVQLVIGDGLGTMDMPKNVLQTLKTPQEAMLVDSVVRAAVREIRTRGARLGDLVKVEIIIGAGVRDNGKRCLVRFFALFSTDGVSTYSCNVSATGLIRSSEDDESINIVALSCAKDEGLGQTIDLIREKSQ
jgi:hypothetical protein